MGPDSKIEKPVVLFDGVCNLCNSSVNFIIDRDPNGRFQFASLQSEEAERLLNSIGYGESLSLETIILVRDQRVYKRSRAALEIAKHLSFPWPLAYAFLIVPAFLRDGVYNFIASNRYTWFGKSDQCRVPTPELTHRFLHSF